MTFLERYKSGETREVYSDIYKLGQVALSKEHFSDVEAVVTETMERVAYNLSVIYNELKKNKYCFKHDILYSFDVPLNQPVADVEGLLIQLEQAVAPFGSVPLSLKLFYKIVGSCNFAPDYESNGELFWEAFDPVQIAPLDSLVEEVTDEYWTEGMNEYVEDDDIAHLDLSADYLIKDNISGGPAYAIEITKHPSVDGRFLNEEHQTTFIDYLRIVFEGCGFGRMEAVERIETFDEFYENVRPKLKMI